MRRAALYIGAMLILSIPATAGSADEGDSTGSVALPNAAGQLPQPPESAETTSGTELDPGFAGARSQALRRVHEPYERKIRELEEVAMHVKGMELIDLQRRIEALKRAQWEEELDARIGIAREAGDDRLLGRLERLRLPAEPPQASPEFRPPPALPDADGGER